jgi:hypothetical protein
LVPSDRVIVPRSLDFAPPDAVTVPVVVTGGHAPAHAPEQADMPLLSLVHRYTARPDPSAKNVPADDETVVMTVEPEPPLAAAAFEGDAPAGELLPAAPVLLLPVLHAATSSATPKALPAPAASRAGADIRFAMKFRIAFVSL